MDFKKILAVVFIIAVLAVAVIYNFSAIPFQEDVLSKIGGLLALLFFAALILERALDVFLTLGRAPKSEELDELIAKLRKLISSGVQASADVSAHEEKLLEAQKEKRQWRAGTRSLAMWLGFIIGIIISAVGIRTLGSIIDVSMIENNPVQIIAFRVIDTVLTGGLLAGGSDGIHKIAELFRNFFEGQSAVARQKTLDAQNL